MITKHTMRYWLSPLLAGLMVAQPALLMARGGFGGGGGGGFRGGGGGGFGGGGGGNFAARTPSFSGGGGNRGSFDAGNRGNFNSGNRGNINSGNRANFDSGNRNNFNSGNRANFDSGNRANINSGNRANINSGNRANINSGNRANINSGNRANINTGNRANINTGNRTNINTGNRTNINTGNRTNVNTGNRTNINTGNRYTNNSWNRPAYNNNWNHGSWNGNWNNNWHGGSGWWNGYAHGYANRPWYAHPVAWGMTAWAVGSIFYDSGYCSGGSSYSNPYYAAPADSGAGYDYSQPIPTNYQQQAAEADPYSGPAPVTPEVKSGTEHVDAAQDAFKSGDYDKALTEIDLALKKLPNDAALHEFRALVLFAQQKYSQAAGVLYAVLSAGPGWNWTTLSSLYPNTETYTNQLRTLEQYVKNNREAVDGHFVLAYHYITCGHNDAAVKELKEVLRLQPQDQLAAQLLKMMSPPGSTTDAATGTPPTAQDGGDASTSTQQPMPAAIPASKLFGDWTADRAEDNTKFSLSLTSDMKFTWTYTRAGKEQKFGGTYSMDGAVLVLARTDGANMPGLVTLGTDGFNFKLFGGPEGDKGLDFKK